MGPYPAVGYVLADCKSELVPYMSGPSDDGGTITHPFFAASIEDCLEKSSPRGARYRTRGSILAEMGNSASICQNLRPRSPI